MGMDKYRAETNKLMFDLYKFVIKIYGLAAVDVSFLGLYYDFPVII